MKEAAMTGSKEKTARIRDLNDAFRKSFSGGKVLLTPGVNELPSDVRATECVNDNETAGVRV